MASYHLPVRSECFHGELYQRMHDDLNLAGRAERTVHGYLRAVRQLADFCQTFHHGTTVRGCHKTGTCRPCAGADRPQGPGLPASSQLFARDRRRFCDSLLIVLIGPVLPLWLCVGSKTIFLPA